MAVHFEFLPASIIAERATCELNWLLPATHRPRLKAVSEYRSSSNLVPESPLFFFAPRTRTLAKSVEKVRGLPVCYAQI